MVKKNLFLHIGYPKTGTTTMQECISLQIKGVKSFIPNVDHEYLRSLSDDKVFNDNYIVKQLVENFIFEDYDPRKSLALLGGVKENKIFISTTGPLSALFFKGRFVGKDKHLKPEQVAKRISEVFSEEFDVKVIISIRRQSDWIPSAFAEWHQYFSKISDYSSLDKFVSSFKDLNSEFAQDINYSNVVTPFEKILGKDNIYIAVFEQLKRDPVNYYRSLIGFMGGDIDGALLENVPKRNVRETAGEQKRVNVLTLSQLLFFYKLRYFPNLSLGLIKRFPIGLNLLSKVKWPSNNQSEKIKISEDDVQEIFTLYQEENMNLSERYNLGLDVYGYY